MVNYIFSGFFSFCLLLSLADCAAPGPTPATLSDQDTTLEVAIGEVLQVELEANIATGYNWTLKVPADSSYLSFLDETYVENEFMTAKEEGKSVWRFRALKKGSTQLRFIYKRPWEKISAEAKEASFLVQIK